MVLFTQVLVPLALLACMAFYPDPGLWRASTASSIVILMAAKYPMIKVHLKTLNPKVERFRPWRGQSKALHIFRITPLGFHKNGWHAALAYYR
jgi:hypothetical protein